MKIDFGINQNNNKQMNVFQTGWTPDTKKETNFIGDNIWAAGSAVTGINMCFSCTTLEADDSEDYEVVGDGNYYLCVPSLSY